ncbi:MAG TPA: hypothetical protein VIC57_17975 [Candidatus Dormibacteraeota bacterium]|jgi:hypothetical protein
MGALTPLVKVARDWRTWGAAVSLYTLSGLGVTLAAGAGIGELGHVAGLPGRPALVLAAGLAIALVLAARELGVLRFRLPERPLQTEKVWMHQFGPLGAATLWGLHLSLGFFTRVNYGGFWLLTLLALGLGSPRLGALLMGAHWLGKALSVWVAPLALRTSADGSEVAGVWDTDARHYRRVQALGLLAAGAVLAVWLTTLVSGG